MMAKGFDELVNFLLDEIALRFAEGTTLDDFKNAVSRFYTDPEVEQAASDAPIDSSLIPNADRQLQEKAWTWLLLHPDIWVGRPTGQDSSPDILVAADQDSSVLSLIDAESADFNDDESKRIRLWTSHERVWQTVAGHGVDFKRIPGEEFRLLCLIAGAGPKGIAQPELVKMSKQDKKSVPGRTDNLNKIGYIRKTKILAEKHNTSLLVHRRFLPEKELDALSRPVFVNGSLSFENLLGVLKEKLKNGASIKMEALEAFLGCAVRSWEKRALWRALERLDIIGVIQRFRMDEVREGKKGNMRNFKAKYVKLLRDPTEDDFKRYTSLTLKDREDFRRRLEAQDAETKGEHAEYMDDDDYAAQAANVEAAAQTTNEDVAVIRTMKWDSDVAWTNTIFNAVKAAGVAGLSSMASREATYGRFYDRPVEQMLARLTDVWQKAQPDHLRSFNIIRDTDTKGRSTNYLYRTHEAFQQAVDQGNTVWENATSGKPYVKPTPQLDQFGFSRLDGGQFLKQGEATLSESIYDAEVELETTQKSDPILAKNPDGTFRVVWKHDQGSRKPRKGKAGLTGADDDEDGSPAMPKKRRGPKPKVRSSARHQKVITVASEDEATNEPKGPQTEEKLRIQAEEHAFNEAKEQQKLAPVSTTSGKQIASSWKPGKGRPRMILVDDITLTDEVLPQPTPESKRPPVVVLESRVRALFESLKAANELLANPETKETTNIGEISKMEHQIVAPKSAQLTQLERFGKAVNGRTRGSGGEVQSTGVDDTPAVATAATPASHMLNSQTTQNGLGLTASLWAEPQTPLPAESPIPLTRRTHSASVNSNKRSAAPHTRSPVTRKRQRTGQMDENEDLADGGPEDAVSVNTVQQIQGHAKDTGLSTTQVIEDSTEMPQTPARKDWSQRQSTYIRPPAQSGSHRKKKGTVVGRGTAQYKRILLIEQIMEKSGGIFPGDSEMVPAFQKLQKDELKSETTSDRDTIMKAVKALVDDEKLKRFGFFFKDKNGKQAQKWILHHPHIKANSQEVQDLMKKIEEAYPKNYVPPPYGDGETGRPEQRKNIDRFQYRPGKSIIQPSGTEFVIDVEAKRKELEAQRLAAAAAIRAEESRRFKAQAERNKKRQAALAAKPRVHRASLRTTAHPDPQAVDLVDEDDPNTVMPSVETDGIPPGANRSARTRYRSIRPAPPIAETDIAKAGSGFCALTQDPVVNKRPRPPLAPTPAPTSHSKPQPKSNSQLLSAVYHSSSVAITPAQPDVGPRPVITDNSLIRDSFVFREPQGPQTYDSFYELQDVTTLLCPVQRFHPNTGTFSTDFFIRTNVRHSHWLEPRTFAFEHHTITDLNDVDWYTKTDDYDNFYHPDKKPRNSGPGFLSKRTQHMYSDDESDGEFQVTWFEKQELLIMKQQYPDLIHEPVRDGFFNFSLSGFQETAKEIYKYGIRPMEHIVLHGAEPEDYPGIQFEEHGRRPNLPKVIRNELDPEFEDDLDPVPTPHITRRPRASYRGTLGQIVNKDVETSLLQAGSNEKRSGHQSGKCYISSADSRRLFFACIAVRVLCGELEGTISWNAIRAMFAQHPNFDLPTFKARWHRMCTSYKDVADRVQREFQDAFINAYDKGLLPALDVMHGSKLYYKNATNWNRLVDWAVNTIPVFPDEIGLPPTRNELDKAFEFKTGPSDAQDMREKLEHLLSTHAKREEIAHKMSFAVPLSHKSHHTVKNLDFAGSWVRANCAAADDKYNAAVANAKLKKLDQSILMAVTKQLHSEKIIAHSFRHRNKAARNYHLSDQYNQIFNKRPLNASNFAEALAFKARLDSVFSSSTPRLLLDYGLSDGAIMAVTEMLAAGRVLIRPVLPPVNSTIGDPWPRLTVWGFNEGQYKMRNVDKKTFLWDIELVPTNKYNAGLPTSAKVDKVKPPRTLKSDKTDNERIPLWYDIHGNLIPKYWEAIVRSVVQHLAVKAGSTIATLTAPYRGLVWDWEIKMLVEWLVEVGAAKYDADGSVIANEWWWTVVPKGAPEPEDELQGNGIVNGIANGQVDRVAERVSAARSPAHAPKRRRLKGGKTARVGRNGS